MLCLVVPDALLRAGRLHAPHRSEQQQPSDDNHREDDSKNRDHACTSSSVGGKGRTNGFPNALWERGILLRDSGPDDPAAGNRLPGPQTPSEGNIVVCNLSGLDQVIRLRRLALVIGVRSAT